jgi:hypothetical protein
MDGAPAPPERMIDEAQRLATVTREGGVTLRFLGGVAVAVHCGRENEPHRAFSDLDAVVRRGQRATLIAVLEQSGYTADERFNAFNGASRLIFYGPAGKLDVFVDAFEMCHRIALADRLDADDPTLTVADLILTKLQVVELTDKDVQDLELLLRAHGLGHGPGDHVDVEYLGRALGRDWGLWRTATGSLAALRRERPGLDGEITALEAAIGGSERTLGFKLRGLVGERKRWYELPEEVGAEEER